jgi:methionyl-tRNA formyltransferase
MRLDKEIDHGPILGQEKEEILSSDTAETLYKKLFEKGASLLPNVLNKYLKDNLKLITQEHEKATFTKPLARQDGFIDISKLETRNSKSELEQKIRAYFPWPGVWFKTKLNNTEKIIKLLPGEKLQVEGKKPMSYKDFLNGYPEAKEILGKII